MYSKFGQAFRSILYKKDNFQGHLLRMLKPDNILEFPVGSLTYLLAITK